MGPCLQALQSDATMLLALRGHKHTCHAARGFPDASVFSSAATAWTNVFMSYLMALWLTAQPAPRLQPSELPPH